MSYHPKCSLLQAFFLRSPDFADIFVWREALQRLETPAVIVIVDEVDEVIFELSVTTIMIASDGRFLDRPVHSLDLTVGPRVLDLGQPSMAETNCAKWRRESVPVGLREKVVLFLFFLVLI